MVATVKAALRISANNFDGEITDLIAACKSDLKMCGVVAADLDTAATAAVADATIARAIILYAKANFGFNDDSEKYRAVYESLKNALCLAGDYIEVDE